MLTLQSGQSGMQSQLSPFEQRQQQSATDEDGLSSFPPPQRLSSTPTDRRGTKSSYSWYMIVFLLNTEKA